VFDLLSSDPREGVRECLKGLWVRDNPSDAYRDYQALLGFYKQTPEEDRMPVFSHMITVLPEWRRFRDGFGAEWVADREDLEDLLLVDANAELEEVEGEDQGGPETNQASEVSQEPSEEAQERNGGSDVREPRTKVAVERVSGFWLLPTSAFQECKETAGSMTCWDVSGYPPSLGVFRLPNRATIR
jgi:hypothetical protein